ncbi:hypothetical protein PSTT_03425 [Puccinia striiformis]|uniref:Uncharacterized protein n=1 Tax=Puccinia striiformis TaxID=27350 RepID=A0A2S4VWC0_9BASI|nr:hypothetical protein PSTT_03425 [Puccinia striiformis]
MAELTVPTPGAELLHRKRDLIGKAFDDLGTKYNGSSDWPCVASIVPLDQATWKTLTFQLQSSLLPSLKNQITSFKHNGAIRITEGQRDKIEFHITDTIRTRSDLVPDCIACRCQLKGFRAQGLQTIVEDLISNMCIVFSTCFEFMGSLKLPSQTLNRYGRIFRHKDMLTLETTRAAHAIDGAIKQLKGHEFYYIREDWEDNVFQIHRLLRLVTDVISSANDSDDVDDDDNDSEIVHPSRPAIRVLQSMIPVIKLSRLFFKKLLRSGMKETPLQSYTEMSSDQINALADSARSILYNLDQIYDALTDPVLADESPEEIPRLINEITSEFNTTMLLVVFYIVPVIPQVNNPPSQSPLTTWLVDWNHLFLIAIQDCISATKLL